MTTIKVLITLIPIYFILKILILIQLFELIAGIGLPYLVCAICVVLLEMLVMTQRWKIVLDSISIEINYKDIISIFWIGLFFSQILPTSVGGDAVRGHYLYRRGSSFAKASQGTHR